MKKIILSVLLIYLTVITNVKGETLLPENIIASLRSDNVTIVDKTLKLLGFEHGMSGGFSRFQVLQPWIEKTNRLFIFGLSWSRYDGYLVLLNSEGSIFGKYRVGYIKSISLRQVKEEGDDVIIVDTIAGTGSGIREDRYYIFTINNGALNKIWEGLSYKHEFPMAASPEGNIKITTSINFEDLDNDNTYELIYTINETKYFYNSKTNELSIIKTVKSSKVYIFKNNKYIFSKNLEY